MLICNHCGKLIEDDELGTITECHGHTSLGQPLTEIIIDTNCTCGGDFVQATKCKVCGEWFHNTELYPVCEECMDEEATVASALEMGSYSTENVEINGFVVDALTKEQINKILEKWIEENFVDHSRPVSKYLKMDKDAYTEYLADKFG